MGGWVEVALEGGAMQAGNVRGSEAVTVSAAPPPTIPHPVFGAMQAADKLLKSVVVFALSPQFSSRACPTTPLLQVHYY